MQSQLRHYNWLKIILPTIAIVIGGGIAHYATREDTPFQITPYQETRDLQDIVNLFENNWYWLTTRDYEPGYAEFVFKTKSPNDYDTRYAGQLRVDVARENGEFVGFVSYYLQAAQSGQVLFLAVRPEFRGKGYGEKLLVDAFKQLAKLGAQRIWLVTRTDNEAAQKLYNRAGMIEMSRDDGFVYFDLKK